MTEWQPIETAPKDGSWFLIWVCDEVDLVWWTNSLPKYPWITKSGDSWAFDLPTHWMPLPSPPQTGDEG